MKYMNGSTDEMDGPYRKIDGWSEVVNPVGKWTPEPYTTVCERLVCGHSGEVVAFVDQSGNWDWKNYKWKKVTEDKEGAALLRIKAPTRRRCYQCLYEAATNG